LDSNEIDESDLQNERHLDSRISTPFGIKIDVSDVKEKHVEPIRVNCDANSYARE
jgi:hypothetical protein